ncbi:MAG: hypothetical protein AB7O56_09040 [Bauldia sp.]
MRRLRHALPFAAGLAIAVPAIAQDGLVWIAAERPEGVGLIYGLPESDHVVFTLDCDRESLALTITYLLDGEIGRPEPFVLGLTSEGGTIEIDAAQVHLEMLDLYLLETKTTLDEPLAAIFTTGTTLTVTVGELTQELPLPAAEELQPLLDACLVVG